MAEAPFEVVAAPFEVYIGPVAETMPAVTLEPPAGNWVLIGTLGSKEYSEDGVIVELDETIEDFRGLGSTAPLKAFRTDEELVVKFMLHDITLEEWARILNNNTVTAAANDKTIPLYRGQSVSYRALLVRGNEAGPYGTGYNVQFELPRVRPVGSGEIAFTKGVPAGLNLEFHAMADLNAASDALQFGVLRTKYQN